MERLGRVRLRTMLPSRKDSRSKMAGGDLRLGTRSIYMNTYNTIYYIHVKLKSVFYMGTYSCTILPFSHQINDIGQNRLRIRGKFGLASEEEGTRAREMVRAGNFC